MKKSKLIEMLSAIEGDVDIKLWNGMVGDWVEIDTKLVPTTLVRMTKAYWLKLCMAEKRMKGTLNEESLLSFMKTLATQHPKVCKWQINPHVSDNDIKLKHYEAKKVQIMQAKLKGESCFERTGTMSY